MSDHTLLGPWIRRFLLEHVVAERNLARNTQHSYRDAFGLLIPFVARMQKKSVDRLAVVDLSADLVLRTPEIERLTIPTLLVWGAEDGFQPLRYGKKLADALPNAELKIIEGAGHFLPEDCPDVLGQLVVAFIERV